MAQRTQKGRRRPCPHSRWAKEARLTQKQGPECHVLVRAVVSRDTRLAGGRVRAALRVKVRPAPTLDRQHRPRRTVVSRRAHGCLGVRVVEPSAEVPREARPARSPKTRRPAVQPRWTRRRQPRSGRAEGAHRAHAPAAARRTPLLQKITARTVADGSTYVAGARI